jgi:ABC-2 type transport system ATP-binding protein
MGFIASIYPEWDEAYASLLVDRFELRRSQKLHRYSHGERVKAMLLLALARRPRLLVLDEPTTGLDPIARHEVLAEFMDVLLDEDRTILFSSHNTQDVEQISDQITFIDRGRIVESRDKESFLDRWRRVRLELTPETALPELPNIVEVQRDGHQAVVTADDFDASLVSVLEQAGAKVHAVEPMTLEEIFIANVKHGRKRMQS